MHIIRFEDLLTKKKEIITGTFEFLLGVEKTEGLYIGKRIDDVLAVNEAAGQLYKPRSGKANSNLKYYSPEQLEYVKTTCREYINFLGYSKVPGEDNDTGFFEYSDLTEHELQDKSGYKEFNKANKVWYMEQREEVDNNKHFVHKIGEGIKIEIQDEPFFKFKSIRHAIQIQKHEK